jgi:hypothetical protein
VFSLFKGNEELTKSYQHEVPVFLRTILGAIKSLCSGSKKKLEGNISPNLVTLALT